MPQCSQRWYAPAWAHMPARDIQQHKHVWHVDQSVHRGCLLGGLGQCMATWPGKTSASMDQTCTEGRLHGEVQGTAAEAAVAQAAQPMWQCQGCRRWPASHVKMEVCVDLHIHDIGCAAGRCDPKPSSHHRAHDRYCWQSITDACKQCSACMAVSSS